MKEWVEASIAHKKASDRKFSQAALSRALAERLPWNPDRSKVNKILKQGRKVSAEEMYAIAEITGYAPPAEDASSLLEVPILSWVSAGGFDVREGRLQDDALSSIAVGGLPPGSWFALIVDGESMNRIAPKGSIAIANRYDNEPRDGKFYIIANDMDYSTTFKRYRENPIRLEPYSSEPDHDVAYLTEGHYRTIGRVTRIIVDLK